MQFKQLPDGLAGPAPCFCLHEPAREVKGHYHSANRGVVEYREAHQVARPGQEGHAAAQHDEHVHVGRPVTQAPEPACIGRVAGSGQHRQRKQHHQPLVAGDRVDSQHRRHHQRNDGAGYRPRQHHPPLCLLHAARGLIASLPGADVPFAHDAVTGPLDDSQKVALADPGGVIAHAGLFSRKAHVRLQDAVPRAESLADGAGAGLTGHARDAERTRQPLFHNIVTGFSHCSYQILSLDTPRGVDHPGLLRGEVDRSLADAFEAAEGFLDGLSTGRATHPGDGKRNRPILCSILPATLRREKALGVPLELLLAVRATEVVDLAEVLAAGRSLFRRHFHVAHRVPCHDYSPLSLW